MTDRDDYAGRGREGRPRRAGRPRPGDGGPAAVDLRAGQARPQASSTSRTCCSTPSACWPSTAQVADAVREQYHHLVVDEYQDVSPLQQALLDQWLGGRDELCVVGDPNQTIYSFAGASPDFLHRRSRAATRGATDGAAGARLPLHPAGRRAGQPAARTASAQARRSARSSCVAQRAARPGARAARAPRRAGRGRRRVADRDRGRWSRPARRASEIAVLFRTNGQSETYEQALADAGVPYLLRGGERFFDRPEVREAWLLLRGAARSADADDAGRPRSARVCAAAAGASAPPAGGGAVRERWESLAALARLADDLAAAARRARPLRDFVAELDERADAQHAPDRRGRDARVAARGQGPRVGRRLPRRR